MHYIMMAQYRLIYTQREIIYLQSIIMKPIVEINHVIIPFLSNWYPYNNTMIFAMYCYFEIEAWVTISKITFMP